METMSIKLEKTCHACPEQYDMYIGDEIVGYFRLRHGRFTVEYPNCGGELVYESYPNGDGVFDNNERAYHLHNGVTAILGKIMSKKLDEIFKDPSDEFFVGPEGND